MIPEIDTPIEYVHYSWKELKNHGLPAGARWENCKNVLASENEIQVNLLLITKRSTYRKCSIALFLVASMSA